MKVAVLGGTGQVGGELKRIYPGAIYPGRKEIDLSSEKSVDSYFKDQKVDLVVNCAAYTLVDKAESESELCHTINARSLEWISRYAQKIVHFSTDYVFDGKNFKPYLETDSINPINAYGSSKASGEEILLKHCPNAVILRTSWVYSDLGKNFVKTILNLSKQKEEITVVSDQIGSPTSASDLAKLVGSHAIERWQFRPGIYHFSNEGVASWYDFAWEVVRLSGSQCRVIPVPSERYPTAAKRPSYSVFSKEKIKSELGISIPHWKTSLEETLKKIL